MENKLKKTPLGKTPEGVLLLEENENAAHNQENFRDISTFLDDALTEGLIYERLGFIAPLPKWTEKGDVWKQS